MSKTKKDSWENILKEHFKDDVYKKFVSSTKMIFWKKNIIIGKKILAYQVNGYMHRIYLIITVEFLFAIKIMIS